VVDSGGVATLRGVRYEVLVALYHVPDIWRGEIQILRYQPPSGVFGSENPKEIHLDDLSWKDSAGETHFAQIKKSTRVHWTIDALGKSKVIAQLVRQFHQDVHSHLHFISNIPSQKLLRLIDHAARCLSTEEFLGTLSGDQKRDFGRLKKHSGMRHAEDTLEMLRRVTVDVLTEQAIGARLADFAAGQGWVEVQANAVYHRMKEFIETTPGAPLDKRQIRSLASLPSDLAVSVPERDAYVSHGAKLGRLIGQQVINQLATNDVQVGHAGNGGLLANSATACRLFVAVITEDYLDSPRAVEELALAQSNSMDMWALLVDDAGVPAEFDAVDGAHVIRIASGDSESAIVRLRRYAGAGNYIATTAQEMAIQHGPATGLMVLDRLSRMSQPKGVQLARVHRQRAHFLRLIGDHDGGIREIREAAKLIRDCGDATAIYESAVTLSQLYVDQDRFEAGRSALQEALLALARLGEDSLAQSEAGKSERLLAVGEVSREMARTYLEEARRGPEPVKLHLLETAWAQYTQAAALLSLRENRVAYAWICENVGDLLRLYAEGSTRVSAVATDHTSLSSAPCITRMRGKKGQLMAEARNRLEESMSIFSSHAGNGDEVLSSQEGDAWAHFHLAELLRATDERVSSIPYYREALTRFRGSREGAGLCHLRLYEALTKEEPSSVLAEDAENHGVRALAYCDSREYLRKDATRLRQELKKGGAL